MLEESEAARDFVAFFVEVPVVFTLNNAVTFGRDNGLGTQAFYIGNDGVGVVSGVQPVMPGNVVSREAGLPGRKQQLVKVRVTEASVKP